jgi:hypothetical protein
MSKYLITEAMKQELEPLLANHPTQLMELRMLEPVKALTSAEIEAIENLPLSQNDYLFHFAMAVEQHHFGVKE